MWRWAYVFKFVCVRVTCSDVDKEFLFYTVHVTPNPKSRAPRVASGCSQVSPEGENLRFAPLAVEDLGLRFA